MAKPGDMIEFSGEYFLSDSEFEIRTEPAVGLVVEVMKDYQNAWHTSGTVAAVLCSNRLLYVPIGWPSTHVEVKDQ